ncbi:phosphate ABC transporter ATP-binding protein [Desulfallas sp. Bu1-1]|jgi:phosphate transport system ATP-binding protein|uniref:phosphate ABC transporter ATP-binding protein PstB n=1 Tax=Desulfallas sp. Bu1-1 TaxID=2787620 RepID=UPI0018A0AEE0|nr:phosphate ABC transporter ATP-binding protein PstB [Desulfallas sp. Bu1-1]MBF7083187.1 phosphate ABC transporter ATP-binding protein [Desulfallas sp. Bu1-1]
MESKISVRNLNLFYKNFHALHNINMDIVANKTTALIGPPGCGKSTFLRALNRLHDLYEGVRVEGEVLLDGANIYNDKCNVMSLRKKVGMVFQKPNPFPMSIYDNVASGPRIHGIKNRKRLDEIVEMSLRAAALWEEVSDRLKYPAMNLTSGQQQRLCIARLLAVEPEVVLMDEPTSTLDPASALEVEELIYMLKRNYTVVIVTRNMRQAARVSDYTAFFLAGNLVEFGSTGQIFTTPADRRTEDYITGRFG